MIAEEAKMDFSETRKYIGHLDQLFNIKTFRYCGGKAEGMLATEVHNGAQLDVTIAADRCMDLYRVVFKGVNISYLGGCGVVHPAYYDAQEDHWHKSFTAGMLTTCGLDHFGCACTDKGEQLGLHGEIGNTPAEQYCVSVREENGIPAVHFQGVMKQARLFHEHFELERHYAIRYGVNEIEFEDIITNVGYRPWEFMQLYHFNYGYPFSNENVQIFLPTLHIEPRDEAARRRLASWNRFEKPQDDAAEMCYFHTMGKNQNGISGYTLYNPDLDIGVSCEYDGELLNRFIEWKSIGSGEYVLGMEPANAWVTGRAAVRNSGELKMLPPQAKEKHRFLLRFLDGKKQLDEALERQEQMKML